MNIDDDYDNDGNNIVPCPICLDVYCPSKEDGKCPEEDEFAKDYMPTPDTEWEKIVGKFWESEVPVEDEYGGDKAGWLKNSPIAKFMLKTLSSRDTYWKERVEERFKAICTINNDGDCKYFRDDIHVRLLRGDKFVAQEILNVIQQ